MGKDKVTVGYQYNGENGSFQSSKEIFVTLANWSVGVATWKEDQLNPENYKILYVYHEVNGLRKFLFKTKEVKC